MKSHFRSLGIIMMVIPVMLACQILTGTANPDPNTVNTQIALALTQTALSSVQLVPSATTGVQNQDQNLINTQVAMALTQTAFFNLQALPTATNTQAPSTPTLTVPATSICGLIENNSTTGAMAPIMTVWGTGQVLQLWNLNVDAIQKFHYVSPAYYRVYDPVYQAPDLLINFSSIEQVSGCP